MLINLPDIAFASTKPHLGLYPVVDSLTWINRMLDAGVTTLQLRIKNLAHPHREKIIACAIALAERYQARLFINDYWQLAIEHQAYGVYLGQEDLVSADLSAIQRAGLRLGISTHNEKELAKARRLRPSYIALGHIFPTQTKQMPSPPQGLVALKRQVANTPDYPTVAIGGISIELVPQVLACGVSGVAVVSAITQVSNWRQATATLLQLIEKK
ncbi:thiamine phosphate synthase [Candidatus Fukatsuia symbiotica]|uniref:Thiamine-phosphate synthase n=1 Tax=Candidatus Fukatsuia symbiotica TaxID=1878942 RepID=A0A2U8I6G1_9GAMM|nr:thiamine phosphate synthase [Candidatus Fukatsuia symbiotica]AWK14773.1 thiamine phosphate synthase [Candidatus Fukatsuia symbiotica]MEA9445104.1 thiamine phosphate synthase [Candidatus Fukatsuia symbiotica]